MDEASVKVALRVRPLTAKEQMQNCNECIGFVPGQPQVVLDTTRAYTFDYVFDTNSEQLQLFNEAVLPLIDRFFEGYNATVLAYGQTGSGKTYSMGTGLDMGRYDAETQGIIPRAIDQLFNRLAELQQSSANFKFQLFVSFLELYNEELIDLLNPHTKAGSRKASTLTIREDGQGGIYWSGVKEEPVSSAEELISCLQKGSLCRTTGSTDMNMTSSRSHAIFSIILRQEVPPELSKADENQEIQSNIAAGDVRRLNSKFHFVDLAGSERMKKTKAVGDRAKEGISINSGLLAMGKVIHALNDGASHVPYRDSKLTRLLQDSLGGNSQTLMIACVSPADSNFGETLNTLNYASRARNIRNKIMINQDYQAMEIHQLRAEISRLKMELMTQRSGGSGSGLNVKSSFERVASSSSIDNFVPSTTVKRLKSENDALKQECQQLEMQVYRLQQRNNEMQSELLTSKTERDSLLFSQLDNKDGNPTGADGDGLNGEIAAHPLVAHYNQTISELTMKLNEAEDKIAAIRASGGQPGRPGSSTSVRSNMGTVDDSPLFNSRDVHLSSKISETIAKAKHEIRKELDLVKQKRRVRQKSVEKEKVIGGGEDMESNTSVQENDISLSSLEDDEPNTAAEDEMLEMLDQIQNDITIKEELVQQLEKTQEEYQVMRGKYEDKLKQLQDNMIAIQKERDFALKKSETGDDKEKSVSNAVKQRYEEKVRKLSSEISEIRRRYQDLQRDNANKRTCNEAMIKTMRNHVESLKTEKMKLMKRLKEKENALKEREAEKDREICRLKRKEQQAAEQAKKLERANHMHQLMLKRRTEEHVQTQNKLRSVVHLLKKTRPVHSPIQKKRYSNFESPRRPGSAASSQRSGSPPRTPRGRRSVTKALINAPSSYDLSNQRDEDRLKIQAAFKKNLLDHDITAYIGNKNRTNIAEELIEKREELAQEKMDLSEELTQLTDAINQMLQQPNLNARDQDKLDFLQQQKQEVMNRLEIIDAEMNYCSARIRSIQIEAAGAEQVDMGTGFENTMDMLDHLDPVEARKLLEMMLEDVIALRMAERTRHIEIQQLEKETQDLRKTVQYMRAAALKQTTPGTNPVKLAGHKNSPPRKKEVGKPQQSAVVVPKRPPAPVEWVKDLNDIQQDFNEIDAALGALGPPSPIKPLDVTEQTPTPNSPTRSRAWSAGNLSHDPSSDVMDSADHKSVSNMNSQASIGLAAQSPSKRSSKHSSSSLALNTLHNPAASGHSQTSSQILSQQQAQQLHQQPPIFPVLVNNNQAQQQLQQVNKHREFLQHKEWRERNKNVFERLHKEQTIASQMKMKDGSAVAGRLFSEDGSEGGLNNLNNTSMNSSGIVGGNPDDSVEGLQQHEGTAGDDSLIIADIQQDASLMQVDQEEPTASSSSLPNNHDDEKEEEPLPSSSSVTAVNEEMPTPKKESGISLSSLRNALHKAMYPVKSSSSNSSSKNNEKK